MKKLIILSDSHGKRAYVRELAPLFAENDYIIHLGDGASDAREIFKEYPEKTYPVGGNCDFCSPYPDEGVLEVEGVRIFYCHGHKYGVKRDLTSLAKAAKEKDCDVALYGHTHRASVDKIDGVSLINPGTMSYPLHQGGSYCYLVVHKKEVTPTIVGSPLQ